MPCAKTGCTKSADGVVGIEVYPVKVLMEFYKTTKPLTTMILALPCCEDHRAGLTPAELLGEGLDKILDTIERSTKTVIDRDACKIVRVAFSHPDYVKMLR